MTFCDRQLDLLSLSQSAGVLKYQMQPHMMFDLKSAAVGNGKCVAKHIADMMLYKTLNIALNNCPRIPVGPNSFAPAQCLWQLWAKGSKRQYMSSNLYIWTSIDGILEREPIDSQIVCISRRMIAKASRPKRARRRVREVKGQRAGVSWPDNTVLHLGVTQRGGSTVV